MKRTLFCILFALSFCYRLMAASGVYDVRDFGAKGNGIALDHVAINKAIEAATAGGSIGTGDKTIALKLQNAGKDVNYLLTWNRPHSGDYALDELFQWIRDIME